jgi:hypothetical protein
MTSRPSQQTKWNGFMWDSVAMTVSVDPEKMARILTELQVILAAKGGVVTRRAFESCRGRLVWAARVVWGGRTYTSGLHAQALPAKPGYSFRLSKPARDDLTWWVDGFERFNGKAQLLGANAPTMRLVADACGAGGLGYFFSENRYEAFAPGELAHLEGYPGRDCAIQVWETFIIYVAILRNPDMVRNTLLAVWTDNPVTARSLRDLRHKVPEVHDIVKRIFLLSVELNFRIVYVEHIPGKMNGLADSLSRGQHDRFRRLLAQWMGRGVT